ncbi:MAG: hypothetical protein AAF806_32600 [Bacteroidota bacterium]
MRNLFLLSILCFIFACNNDTVEPSKEVSEDAVIWTGAATTFTKAADADPTLEANQDRITDNVWLTRGTNGGQIFNAKDENNSDKNDSPKGTLWAEGSIDNIENLTFEPFRTAVGSPKSVVGKDLVLFLQDDDIYLSVKFTSWAQSKSGAFSYERSTEN